MTPVAPSLWAWGLTVASLLVTQPRLGIAAMRLFLACYALRLDPYRAIGDGTAFTFGAAVALALVKGAL